MRPVLRKVSAPPSGKRLATVTQHQEATKLANELGIPKPFFFWSRDAQKEIDRMELTVNQPMLAGFSASTGAGE